MERADFKIEIWSLIGPTLTLAAIAALFILQSPISLPLSLLALFGIFLCWKWRIHGVLFASSLLITFFIYQYFYIQPNNLLWHSGVELSLMLSFLVTGLSHHEIEEAFTSLKQEIQSNQLQFQHSQQSLIEKVRALELQLNDAEKESIAIKENHHTRLEDERQSWVEKVHRLESLLKESSQEIGRISEAASTFARDSFAAQEELKTTREEFEIIQEAQKISREEFHQKQAEEYKHFQSALQKMEEQIQHLNFEKKQLEAGCQLLQEQLEKEKQKIPPVQALPEESHGWLRRIEGQYKQLSEQFAQKVETLEETRRDLFFTQEKLLLVQREYEESWYENPTLESTEKYILKIDKELQQAEEENAKLRSLLDKLILS